MDLKKSKNTSPRISNPKLYNSLMNSNANLNILKVNIKIYKDVVTGTLERSDLIEETINTTIK